MTITRAIAAAAILCAAGWSQIPSVPNTDFPTFRSNLNASLSYANGHVNGVTYPASPSLHTVPVVTSAGAVVYLAIPNCTLLGYNTGTDAFSCATSATPSAHASTHGSAGADPVSLDASQIVSGIFGANRLPALGASGGSHQAGLAPDPGASAGTTRYLREDATWQAITGTNAVQLQGRTLASTAPTDLQVLKWNNGGNQWEPGTIAFSWISGAVAAAQLPTPTSSTLGGVKSLALVSHNFLTSIGTDGGATQGRPACADLSDAAASCSTDATNAANIGSGTLPIGRLPAPLSIDGTTAQLSLTKGFAGAVNVVSYSATPTFDLATGNAFEITLTGNITSATFTHLKAGLAGTVKFLQDGTGGRTVVIAAWTNFCSVIPDANAFTVCGFKVNQDGTTVEGTGGVSSVANSISYGATGSAASVNPPSGSMDCRQTSTGYDCLSSAGVHYVMIASGSTGSGMTVNQCWDFGADNGAADLVDGDLGPQTNIFKVPAAMTVVEIATQSNGGTPNLPVVQKLHYSAGSWTATDLTSGVLATGTAETCASTGAACTSGEAKSGTVSIVTAGSANVLAAGDWIQTKTGSGFASTGAKRVSVCLIGTRN